MGAEYQWDTRWIPCHLLSPFSLEWWRGLTTLPVCPPLGNSQVSAAAPQFFSTNYQIAEIQPMMGAEYQWDTRWMPRHLLSPFSLERWRGPTTLSVCPPLGNSQVSAAAPQFLFANYQIAEIKPMMGTEYQWDTRWMPRHLLSPFSLERWRDSMNGESWGLVICSSLTLHLPAFTSTTNDEPRRLVVHLCSIYDINILILSCIIQNLQYCRLVQTGSEWLWTGLK